MITGTYDVQGTERNPEAMAETLWRDTAIRKCIVKECQADVKRTGVLYDILTGGEGRTKKELLGQIYLFGSMLRERDLFARQLFLWLLEAAEQGGIEM